MFWSGFIGVYVVLIVIAVFTKYTNDFLSKLSKVMSKIFCSAFFSTFTYMFLLIYTMLSIELTDCWINACVCVVFLIFSWWVTEKMYKLMDGDNGTLSLEDKNVCFLLAMFGMIFTSIVLSIKYSDINYNVLTSIAISILLGSYIPIEEIYDGRKNIEVLRSVIKKFKGVNVKVWITGIVCVSAISVLGTSETMVKNINNMILGVGQGVIAGSAFMLISAISFSMMNEKKTE